MEYGDYTEYGEAAPETVRRSPMGALFAAFVCGVTAGVAVGLLFAPARGRITRARVSRLARDGRERVSTYVETTRKAVKDGSARANAMATEAGAFVREKARKLAVTAE